MKIRFENYHKDDFLIIKTGEFCVIGGLKIENLYSLGEFKIQVNDDGDLIIKAYLKEDLDKKEYL